MTKSEILHIFDVNQLQPDKTQYACGYFATALCFAANKNGLPFKHDAAWVIQSAFLWYAEDNGSSDISNHKGMQTIEELYNLIVRKGGHYQAITPQAEVIRAWVEAQYPVIVTVGESTVYDADLHRNPYTWDSGGWNHIIVATGIDTGHILLCRDTVNQNDGSPYRYDFDKMRLIEATVFVPEWMPRPTGATPQGGTMNIPTGWHDDGTTLTAPNGGHVTKGFRDYILTHPWNSGNVPLTSEMSMTQLEESNPGLGGGTQQFFDECVLEWTQAHGVFPMWAGRELLKSRQQAASLYTRNQALEKQVAYLQDQLAQLQAAPVIQPPQTDPRVADFLQRLTQIHTLSDLQEAHP